MFKRLITSFTCLAFIFTNLPWGNARDFSINQLPAPGTMVGTSLPFEPLALKGLIVNPLKPLEFQFIVDTGHGPRDIASVKDQANQLVKYFLAGLTIPEGDLWVNLSPYERNRILPQALGQTDLGRDLLAQDYVLKQLTASLIYPEKDLGKAFWNRVYAKAREQFGTTNVRVNTFNKVWILPDQAQVFENRGAAYVTKATLKVMLDEDYLALQKQFPPTDLPAANQNVGVDPTAMENNRLGSQIVRQIILPEIEKEVNSGKNFAPLRQIYDAMILAKWYKETIVNGLLDAIYINKTKTAGIDLADPVVKEQIYRRYLHAYKKGVFNYIKEEAPGVPGMPGKGQGILPRKYFSGGLTPMPANVGTDGAMSAVKADGAMIELKVDLKEQLDEFSFKGDVAKKIQNIEDAFAGLIERLKIDLMDIEREGRQRDEKQGRFRNRIIPDSKEGEDGKKVPVNKLVRDNIPEILRQQNVKSVSHTAQDDEYKQYLILKLKEEFGYLQSVLAQEESADKKNKLIHELSALKAVVDTIKDQAMRIKVNLNGGIDLNKINVKRNGKTVNVQFDPAQLGALEQGGFEGFTPVITGFQYIKSPFPLLGINTARG